MTHYAVVPTKGDRMQVLNRCVAAIRPQVERVIVIDNSGGIGIFQLPADPGVEILYHAEQPPNLSRLWNLGLERADELAQGQVYWEIGVINDDAIVPPHWFDELAQQMRSAGCAAAGYGPRLALHRTPGTTDLWERMPGHAFMLAGDQRLRADENLRWWCGDNDLDMQARRAGGTLIVPMDEVQHLHPDESTVGVLREQTAKDMAYFVGKWGFRPWLI